MNHLTFDKLRFLKTIILFVMLSTVFSLICQWTNFFSISGYYAPVLIPQLGFMFILTIAIMKGQGLKGISKFLYLYIVFFLIFWLSGVFSALIADSFLSIERYVLFYTINALLVSVSVTLLLRSAVRIEMVWLTIGLMFLCLWFAQYLIYKVLSDDLEQRFNIDPILTMFNIFQFFLVVPLAIGMNLKRKTN